MFYMELDNEQVKNLLQDEYDIIFSSEAIEWIENEISWSNNGEDGIPIFDVDLITSRYKECSLPKFFEEAYLNFEDLDFLDEEDISQIFGNYIPDYTDAESYLKDDSNFYFTIKSLSYYELKNLIESYCDYVGISYLMLENGNIVFNAEY